MTEEEVRALLTLKDYKLKIMNHPSHLPSVVVSNRSAVVYVATIFNENGIAVLSREGTTNDDASANAMNAFVIWDQKPRYFT